MVFMGQDSTLDPDNVSMYFISELAEISRKLPNLLTEMFESIYFTKLARVLKSSKSFHIDIIRCFIASV